MNRTLEIYAELVLKEENPFPHNEWCAGFFEARIGFARYILSLRDEEIAQERNDIAEGNVWPPSRCEECGHPQVTR